MQPTNAYPIINRLISPELRLAQFRPNQAQALFDLVDANRERLRRRLTWVDRQRNLAHTKDFIMDITRLQHDNGAPTAGIWAGPKLLGVVSLHEIIWPTKSATLGFWVDAEIKRQGIATKAVGGLRDFAFRELGLNRVEIVSSPDNLAAAAIATKLGFTPQQYSTTVVWPHDPKGAKLVFGQAVADAPKPKSKSR
ncbi:GNAT family N-acetyltransferase [Candidatus Saccharibacteria bacterium]|nr:GNAT family N-acetyltransferase [Candidatus Saccharibacteria bacterium]